MDISKHFYPSGLVPAAPVEHGYKNFWVRDGYYVGICSNSDVKDRLWTGMIGVLDRYKYKLEIHAKVPPKYWYEHIHIRYSPDGKEIENEHWLHNQFDAHANWGEVCLDKERYDLAELMVRYLITLRFSKQPAAGAWEDRNSCDAYSLAACIHFLQRAKKVMPHLKEMIEDAVKKASRRLYSLLPFATVSKLTCLSLLGIIWPFDAAGPYRNDIIESTRKMLCREPFGFIRYQGDRYDGEGFSCREGTEYPWILGDCFMAQIEPKNPLWKDRLKRAYDTFGCMPEAFNPQTLKANRNSPLLWAEAIWNSVQ